MRKATVTSGFERTMKAVQSGLKRTMERSGIETDRDVMLYNTMTPEDLFDLSNIYGQDGVLDYVREMERKRFFK